MTKNLVSICPQQINFWVELALGSLFILGGALCLLAAIGLFRFKTFYDRLHMPSLITAGASFFIILVYILVLKLGTGHFPYHAFLLFLLLFLSVPITLIMLGRGALYREMFFFMREQNSSKSREDNIKKHQKTL